MDDYSIDTTQPGAMAGPNSVRRRQAFADALLRQGADSSPAAGGRGGGWITAANRALAGALGGYQSGQIDQQERAGIDAANKQFASSPSLGGFMPMGTADTVGTQHPAAGAVPKYFAADTGSTGKVYHDNEPSPLDPPSGEDRRKMIATILGEESTPDGRLGVANVIRNRAVDGGYGGDTPSSVVTAPKQFEPWSTPEGRARMAKALEDPNQVAAADGAIRRAYGEGGTAPDDPTEGKLKFYAPGAQAALGRPAPAWAQGQGQRLGQTMFYDDDSQTPANSRPASGVLPTSAPAQGPRLAQNNGEVQWAQNVMNHPYSSPEQKRVAAAVLQKAMTPKEDSWSSAGNGHIMNSRTGETKKAYEAEDKKPASVQEYEYYLKDFKPTTPGEKPMPYQTWSVQKARASATNVTTNVGGENKGLDEARKMDAEAVRKNQNEAMPALDDADKNFQIMQDAIDRNGGKLPTGGILGKLGLDAQRTAGYIKENWGVDLGGDPTTATSLETFNKGGIKAAGDMAKAIGGSRVLKVEFENAQRANPGLETSDGGNKYILDLNRNSIAIKRDYYQAQEDFWRSNNHSLDGFQKSWNAEVKSNPRPLSNFSVVPPISNGDGTQFVKLPSTGQGGYSWYRKGQDGLSPITDQNVTSKLEDSAKPLKADKPAPVEKVIGDKTYIKQGNNWFEKSVGAP